ncbi:hypothetical protein LEP1GSC036_4328 [Leptospira weilii str. 2006001853]|uniref:Uncharacterized protein n=1 Tax=Leptospira weilii str. 2006001853 TaxID=1001589 RepID=A0A828Z0E9_9LEPT|nr:hypothetical protein LEP1GSC036_4328 [Leptospira weilii str. 2006001853]
MSGAFLGDFESFFFTFSPRRLYEFLRLRPGSGESSSHLI